MRYGGASLSDAVDQSVAAALDAKGGRGGLIALNVRGEVKYSFNTEGMYRGVVRADGKAQAMIYRESW